jgi:hypothetical protein
MWLPRLTAAIALLALAAMPAGCGSSGGGTSSEGTGNATTERTVPSPREAPAGASAHACSSNQVEELRVTGVDCQTGREVTAAWVAQAKCQPKPGASRFSCSIRGYRCLGAVSDRGLAAFCVKPSRAIAFLAKRD